MGINTDAVQRLYVAYFNRPADPVGLAYWEGQLSSTVAATQTELEAIAGGFSGSAEYAALYAGQSNAQIIDSLYQNLFARAAEPAGLIYWAGQLTSGAQTFAQIALQLTYSAQGTDATAIANKLAAATSFTTALDTTAEIIGYSGTAAAASARTWLATVTDVASTLTTATAGVATAVTSATAAGTASTGTTFTLTTGVDSGASFTGGSGNDSYTADYSGGTDVMSTADALTGGAGTDTLNIYTDGTVFALPTLSGIETVNINDLNDDQSISAATWASVTEANLARGDGAVKLTVGSTVATVGAYDIIAVGDDGAGNTAGVEGVQFALAAAATTVTVNLNKITAAAANGDEDVSVIGAGLTTITVNTTGTASSFDTLDVASATSIAINAGVGLTVTALETGATAAALTIAGAGAVSLGTLDTAIDSVDASSATGALTAAIGTEVDTVMTLGSGNDVITAGSTDALVTANELAVDAGAGTDVLILGDANDVNTAADAARYTNFETIRTATTQDMSLVAGITALQITGGAAQTYSNLTSTQASAITFRANNSTSTAFTLADATGSADSITFNLASTTSTTNVDVIGISVVDFETVNINATTGTNTTGDTAFGFLANSADDVSAINITGTADVTLTVAANVLDMVAVTIDASAMTGTADFTLVQTSDLVAGSSVTGTLNGDTIALGTTLGSTYNGGAGNDNFTGALAILVADGTDDTVINGGTGTDTLTLSDTTTTLNDNHFTWVSNMETLALTNSVGDLSITAGAAFNAAFASGVTITTGTMAATKDVTLNAGLATVDVELTVDATTNAVVLTAAEVNSITTGTGADTITFTGDAQTVGVTANAAQGQIIISTGAGADTISVTVGTLLDNTGGGNGTDDNTAIVITGGTGKDLITKVGTNGDGAYANAVFVVAAGDSTTASYDEITGFDVAGAATFSDGLDFAGTAAVGTLATHLDSGTILSHSITAGFATFDDAATYNAAVVINATNLADVLGYLALNTATNDVVAFAYDSDASGSADATMVYHNGATDSLVELVGVTGTLTLVTTNASDAGKLFIA